jgi:hypothetical protein
MRFLPTSLHGAVDYLWGALLIAVPFLLGFVDNRAALWIALVFGLGAIAYSLVTDYELGLVRLLPMPVHLAIDAVAGIALALAPLALNDGRTMWPFGLFGGFAVVASLVTRTQPNWRLGARSG